MVQLTDEKDFRACDHPTIDPKRVYGKVEKLEIEDSKLKVAIELFPELFHGKIVESLLKSIDEKQFEELYEFMPEFYGDLDLDTKVATNLHLINISIRTKAKKDVV